MINVERIKCGNGNCYIIEEKGKAVLIDTARPKYRERILSACRKADIQLIVLTHGHMDHCQNAAFLAQQLNAPIAMCESDAELIKDNMLQSLAAKTMLGKLVLLISEKSFHDDVIPLFTPDIFLKDGETLSVYGVSAKVIELPGHTNGSIGMDLGEKGIIVGDALMNMFYPTVSMLYHDYDEMMASADKISRLGGRLVYFGHGKPQRNRKWAK